MKCLDKLIEAAITDAYNESEQASGFFTLIDDNIAVSFTTRVPGIDITESDQIVAICMLGNTAKAIPILDLPIPTPLPEGAEWMAAYRRWCGSWESWLNYWQFMEKATFLKEFLSMVFFMALPIDGKISH